MGADTRAAEVQEACEEAPSPFLACEEAPLLPTPEGHTSPSWGLAVRAAGLLVVTMCVIALALLSTPVGKAGVQIADSVSLVDRKLEKLKAKISSLADQIDVADQRKAHAMAGIPEAIARLERAERELPMLKQRIQLLNGEHASWEGLIKQKQDKRDKVIADAERRIKEARKGLEEDEQTRKALDGLEDELKAARIELEEETTKLTEAERKLVVVTRDSTRTASKADSLEKRKDALEDTVNSAEGSLKELEDREGESSEKEERYAEKLTLSEEMFKEAEVRREAAERSCALLQKHNAGATTEIEDWEAKIVKLMQAMDSLNDKVPSRRLDLVEAKSKLIELSSRLKKAKKGAEAVENKLLGVNAKADALEEQCDEEAQALAELEENLDQSEAKLTALAASLTKAEKAADAGDTARKVLEGKGQADKGVSEGLTKELELLHGDIAEVHAQYEAVSDELKDAEERFDSDAERLAALDARVKELEAEVTQVGNSLRSMEINEAQANHRAGGNAGKLAEMMKKLDEEQEAAQSHEELAEMLEKAGDALDGQLFSIQQRHTTIQHEYETLLNEIKGK